MRCVEVAHSTESVGCSKVHWVMIGFAAQLCCGVATLCMNWTLHTILLQLVCVFFRAIHSCPWSKQLWLDGFSKLNYVFSGKELSDLQEVMPDKELNLRTDFYEILLQQP